MQELKISPGGFKTIGIGDEVRIYAGSGKTPQQNNLVAVRGAAGRRGFAEVFDSAGAELLKRPAQLVLMDELGFFENEAEVFKAAVFSVLDSNTPVLGVIKPKRTAFLDTVREHPGTRVVEVTKENREDVYYKVLAMVKEALESI